MAKVVVRPTRKASKRLSAKRLKSERVRAQDGSVETVYVIDAGRPDLGDQLRTVFQLNVDRARRKKLPVAAE